VHQRGAVVIAAFVVAIVLLGVALVFDVLVLLFSHDKDVAAGVGIAALHLVPVILGIVMCSLALAEMRP
jgi:hypothetical protein